MDIFLLILQLTIISIYLFRFSIVDRFPKSIKELYFQLASDMKILIGKWWQTIVIPIFIIFLSYIGWIVYHIHKFNSLPSFSITDSLSLYLLEGVVLAPFSEEIIQCLFLSAAFLISIRVYNNKTVIIFINFAALMIVSFIIANAHFNPTSINWLLRYFHFMVYGAIYYVFKRNLLPAIIAHSSWNFLLLSPIIVN